MGATVITDAVKLVDQNGVPYGVKHVSNKVRVCATPYMYDVAMGNIAAHTIIRRFGKNPDIDDVIEDVWELGGTYVYPADAGIQMQVQSSSANDTAAGTGARTVDIAYLDAALVEQELTLTLNGVTPVTTGAIVNIRRINQFHVMTAGTNGVAAGNITLTNIGATVTYSRISTGWNTSLQALYTVPAGKVLFITEWNGGAGSTAGGRYAELYLRAKSTEAEEAVTIFHVRDLQQAQDGNFSYAFSAPIKILGGSDVKISTVSDSGTANAVVVGGFAGWIE